MVKANSLKIVQLVVVQDAVFIDVAELKNSGKRRYTGGFQDLTGFEIRIVGLRR